MFKTTIKICTVIILFYISHIKSAKILAIYPVASISHQLYFRTLTLELIKRGHDLTVLTTDPAFSNRTAPKNIREIDVHDISYKIMERLLEMPIGGSDYHIVQIRTAYEIVTDMFESQLITDAIQAMLLNKNETFDLLLYDGCLIASLIFSHIYKIPAIAVNSLGGVYGNYEAIGTVVNEAYYPSNLGSKTAKNQFERLQEVLNFYYNQFHIQRHTEEVQCRAVRNALGDNMPDVRDLKKNINMMFINLYSAWDSHRPAPISLKYMGGLHSGLEEPLSEEIKSYLDSSIKGVIFMSLGTNVKSSRLPLEKVQIFTKVFSQLPYDVLWKWDIDTMPNKPKNVRLFKWLPQSVILRHPKIKLFITQGGLQSTDEAITAGVPLIGIPMLIDQWFNTEQYVRYSIGSKLDFGTLTEDSLKNAIETVMGNKSYRANIIRHRDLMHDKPQKALDHAVSWIEYILKHGGSHLQAPAADISWAEYVELELLITVLVFLVSVISGLCYGVSFLVKSVYAVINKIGNK